MSYSFPILFSSFSSLKFPFLFSLPALLCSPSPLFSPHAPPKLSHSRSPPKLLHSRSPPKLFSSVRRYVNKEVTIPRANEGLNSSLVTWEGDVIAWIFIIPFRSFSWYICFCFICLYLYFLFSHFPIFFSPLPGWKGKGGDGWPS